MDHKVKKSGHMNVPAEGFYVDCVCGRLGAICADRADAKKDHADHVAAEKS